MSLNSPSLQTCYHAQYDRLRGHARAPVLVAVDDELSPRYPLLLRRGGGRLIVEITKELAPAADALAALSPDAELCDVMALLFYEGLAYEPDISYISALYARDVAGPPGRGYDIRQLTAKDKRALAGLMAACDQRERMLADISVKDDKALGLFAGGRLAAAASGLRWGEAIVDIGVVTRPDMRAKGYGEAAVRALCAAYADQNPIMQYRTDQSNAASVKLMEKLRFERVFTLTGAAVSL